LVDAPVRFELGRFAVEDDAVEVEHNRRGERHHAILARLAQGTEKTGRTGSHGGTEQRRLNGDTRVRRASRSDARNRIGSQKTNTAAKTCARVFAIRSGPA